MQVQPYLFFEGRCEEALEFYRSKLGAQVKALMRYKDAPAAHEASEGCTPPPPGSADKVMHCDFTIGDTVILASDGMCSGNPKFQGVSLTISVSDDAQAEKLFAALAEGGQVQMPMEPTFFASRFGMVADRFGVSWMVINPLPMPAGA